MPSRVQLTCHWFCNNAAAKFTYKCTPIRQLNIIMQETNITTRSFPTGKFPRRLKTEFYMSKARIHRCVNEMGRSNGFFLWTSTLKSHLNKSPRVKEKGETYTVYYPQNNGISTMTIFHALGVLTHTSREPIHTYTLAFGSSLGTSAAVPFAVLLFALQRFFF